jgi:hypothetical protein
MVDSNTEVQANTEGNGEITDSTFADSFEQAVGTVETSKVVGEESNGEAPLAINTAASATTVADNVATEAAKEKPLVNESDEQVDYKTLFEKEQQRNKSWEGRITKAEQQNKLLQAKLSELESAPIVTSKTETLVDVEDPLIKGFISEMGDDFIKPLDAYIKKTINEAIKPFSERVPVIEQQVTSITETKTKDHYATILSHHKDVAEIIESGELDTYVESLPYKEALEKKKVMSGGSTQQVIDFLNEFKEKTGKVKPAVIENQTVIVTKPTKEKITAATAVKGGSYTIPKGKPNADDFNGAFAEAISVGN